MDEIHQRLLCALASQVLPPGTTGFTESALPHKKSTADLHEEDPRYFVLGNVLLSQNPAVQVPSALEGLTVVFEMGTRGSPPPSSPNRIFALAKYPSI
jgi:hypothetical protein